MTESAKEVLVADIEKRLGGIAFHFEERHAQCSSISAYTRADSETSGPRRLELDRVVTRIKSAEDSILLKLVHLKDSVEKYYRSSGRDTNEIKIVDLFIPYRVAANFVNVNKHGLRGRNAKSAVHDYSVLAFKQEGAKPAPTDCFAGYITVINFDGETFQTLDMILDLIRLWELFLRNHTEISTDDYINRISKVQSTIKITYSAPMPEGMLRDAKCLSQERKGLDIK